MASTSAAPSTQTGTPLQQALAYNDSLAQANKTIAQAVINANNQTPPLVPVAAANTILIAQSRIADFDRQLTPLLASAASITANASQIQMLLGEISTVAKGLGGDLGISDANTQQAIATAVNTVVSASGLVLSTLQAGGLLK